MSETPRPIRVNVSDSGSPFTAVHVAPATIDGADFAAKVAASAENLPAEIPPATLRDAQLHPGFPGDENVE